MMITVIGAASFAAISEDWICCRRAQWKPSSLARYRNILNKHLLPRFGALPVEEIRREALEDFGRELLEAGLSVRSINAVLGVARSVLRHAKSRGFPAEDPGVIGLRQSPGTLRVFSRGEQERLTAYLCCCGDMASRGILLSLYTGLRIGELCALTWGDISLDERCLCVRRTMQRLQTPDGSTRTAVCISPPKSACSLRCIPLPDALIESLRREKRDADCYYLTGCTRYMEPRTMENRFHRALRACSIEGASFHTLRHTFATRCVELGFDVKTLSEILGHATVNITMNRYVHPSMEFKRENMNRLAALLPDGKTQL